MKVNLTIDLEHFYSEFDSINDEVKDIIKGWLVEEIKRDIKKSPNYKKRLKELEDSMFQPVFLTKESKDGE